ncbi:speckle-type POZ protein B-like [Stegodyphus dumicola]|uniref:speckle-type POZ protein B-like n=1 Tax=Stegodyphus dumicola TaxID=202533 RepID=UPI0015AD3C54|nr:speckle-type POZ protein B-like [Stegodyphus dumicola]
MCLSTENLRSSLFVLKSLAGIKWRIELYPFENSVATYLIREDDIAEACKVSFSFQKLDCNGEEIPGILQVPIMTHIFSKNGRHFVQCMKINLILRSLINDILVIKCIFKPIFQTLDQEIHSSLPYKTGLFTDVVLRAHDREFKVHKAMLWTRWPQLAKKLDDEMSFEQDFYIESSILEAMIHYVYTGRVNSSEYEFCKELYVIAARYGLRILNTTPGTIETCETRINAEKITFLWPIEDFSRLTADTQLYHEFKRDIPQSSKWTLRVSIREKTETEQIFSIFVCRTSDYEFKPSFIRTKVSFDDSHTSENEHLFKKDENWKCAEFSRTYTINVEDVLLLRCEIKLSNGSFSSDTVKSSCVFETFMIYPYLHRSLRNLYESGKFSDVTIVVDSRRFPVHKFILCSHSSVFCRMFETEMIESESNQVQISDVDPDIIHAMLLFIYSGGVEKLCVETAMQLYTAADKYDVLALKKMCASFLKSNISVKNVCNILQLAEMHSDDDLLWNAFEFFSDHLQEIFSTKEWKESSKNHVYARLMQHVMGRTRKPTK